MTSTAWAKPRIRIVRWCISNVSSQLKWKQISTIRTWSIPDFTDKCCYVWGHQSKTDVAKTALWGEICFKMSVGPAQDSIRLSLTLDIQDTNSFRGRDLRDVTIFVIPYRCQVWHFQLLTHVYNLLTLRTYWHFVPFAWIYCVIWFACLLFPCL